jgi:hypothetical protein
MGFLNKAFRKVKKQIQPGNMIARDMGPGNMPRRGGGMRGRLGAAALDKAYSQNARTRRYAPTYSQKRSFSARAYTDGQHA